MDRSVDKFVPSFAFSRVLSMCGLLMLGVGCTIAPINCAQPADDGNDNIVDSGTVADAGPIDASSSNEDSGVQDDSGVEAGDAGDHSDGGNVADGGEGLGDAGTSACADSDSDLGTLSLADGFVVAGSASMPDDVVAVSSFIGNDDATHLAILRSDDLSVRDLGVWPDLGEDTVLFKLIADDDSVESPFPSSYLAGNGNLLAAGYTAYDAENSGFPGKIALWNGNEVSYMQADGNYSAAMYDDILLINGLGAGDVGDTAGIYGAGLVDDTWSGKALASFPTDWNAYSGHNAVTSDGVAILGGYFTYNDVMSNHLLAVPAAELSTAWVNGTPVSLENKPVVASGDMLSVAAMGPQLAILRGVYGQTADGVFVTELQVENDTVSAVGDEVAVLTSTDECTPIHFVSKVENDLMVAVGNTGAMKLLRISASE